MYTLFVHYLSYIYIYGESRQTRDVMETGCLLSTMQRFGLLDLLQDLNMVLASMIGILKIVKNSRLSVGAGVVGGG